MNKEKILFFAIVILLVVASAQAVQLVNIKKEISDTGVSISANVGTNVQATSSGGALVDIQADIPDQVGGCF